MRSQPSTSTTAAFDTKVNEGHTIHIRLNSPVMVAQRMVFEKRELFCGSGSCLSSVSFEGHKCELRSCSLSAAQVKDEMSLCVFGKFKRQKTDGFWRVSMDPGGIHTCSTKQPSGMGDVCISLLLCDDLPLAHHLRLWSAQKQQRLGYSGLYLSPYCCYVLSECLCDPGQCDLEHERVICSSWFISH